MSKRDQPLVGFLEDEGLRSSVEAGLRKVAIEFGRGDKEFAAAAFVALAEWKVQPSRSVNRFGSITPRTQTLRLTSLDCSPQARRDTILHEVAHVLTSALVATRDNHGPSWRKLAAAIGAQPERAGTDPRFAAASEALRKSRQQVVARCDGCGFEIKRLRRSSRDWGRFQHATCGGRFRKVAPQAK